MLGKRVIKDGRTWGVVQWKGTVWCVPLCYPTSLYPLKLLGYPIKSTERWGGREARIGAHTRKGSTQGGELGRAEMHTGTCIGVYLGRLVPAASCEGDPGINWSLK